MDRGQTYTLEGVFGAALIILAIVFAIQAVSVSPQSGSLGSQQIAADRRATAQGLLDVAQAQGALKNATLYWNESGEEFPFAPGEEAYYAGARTEGSASTAPNPSAVPPIPFGVILADYTESARANVNLYYMAGDQRKKQPLVYQGAPGSGAVSATSTVALMDGNHLMNATGGQGKTLENSTTFYASDQSGTQFYNTVTVEVVLW